MIPQRTIEQDILEQGFELETRLLAYERKVSPPEYVREALGLEADRSVGYLSMLRLVHDRVICFDQRFLRPEFADDFNPSLVGARPYHDILNEATRLPVTRGKGEIEIAPAYSEVARALRVIPGVLILQNRFANYSRGGMPVEVGMISYRIDRVKFGFAIPYLDGVEDSLRTIS